ncbi:MAG TPA: tetratricopeptide repeat protein, partial [Schlesneria sp.]
MYGFHVESGTLDALIQRFQERSTKNPQDGAAWMILGLIESQRGRDAAAVEAFSKATAAAVNDPLAAYYLGQCQVLIGQPDQAVKAFELALTRKPAQADLLEIFQALGRVHQRAQRTEEALKVWSRLEKLFPNDARVQEQIAAALAEENQSGLALPRYEKLIQLTKDDYRKAVYRIEAAELKVKLNRSQEAIGDLEKLLATLNPSSWLHREVRRKIDDVFLRTDDQDGLAKYYLASVTKNAEDVDGMARLARILARQGRVPEAQVWLDKALKLAPTRKELRQTFIEQLVEDQRFSEAIAQYELLDKAEPNNPDILREWGKLILRETGKSKEDRLKLAEKV